MNYKIVSEPDDKHKVISKTYTIMHMNFLLIFWFYRPSRLFLSFWADSISRWGENRRSPSKKTLTTGKQNLACVTRSKLGSNLQRWDGEWFRTLKIIWNYVTAMILSFRTTSVDSDQEHWRSSLIRVYTVCHPRCIIWPHYSTLW